VRREGIKELHLKRLFFVLSAIRKLDNLGGLNEREIANALIEHGTPDTVSTHCPMLLITSIAVDLASSSQKSIERITGL
jgi:hypothetical protein